MSKFNRNRSGSFSTPLMHYPALENDPELVDLPFTEPVWLDLCIAWRRDAYLSRANQAFVDFLLEKPEPSDSKVN